MHERWEQQWPTPAKRPKGRCRACRGQGGDCQSCDGTGLSEAQRKFDANEHKMIDRVTGQPRGKPPAK